MSLNSNAIINVSTYKILTNIKNTTQENDERYEEFINSASNEIEKYCRRKFRSATLIDTFDGNGNKKMRMKYWPITTNPTEIKYYQLSTETYIALTSPVFQVNQDNGIVTFMDGNRFTTGCRNWQMTYTYGYTLSSMPADLQMACAFQARFIQKIFDENIQNVNSVSFDGGTTSYTHSDVNKIFPPRVQTVLDRYRSKRRVVRA